MKGLRAILGAACCLTQALSAGHAQQIPDHHADVTVSTPAFNEGAGPAVAIDAGHYNFHTLEGRYAPFAALLRSDGFRISAFTSAFSAERLRGIDILVVANALNAANVEHWSTPVAAAFAANEIAAVQSWVAQGGSLLLIADHFPFAGAAADLAAAFDFELVNGFALATPPRTADVFTRRSGALQDDIITRGRGESEKITELATFTGSAFRAPPTARPLITLPKEFVLLLPTVAWRFNEQTPWYSGAGYLQGAAMRYGEGRIAVFADAGMFTAQRNQLDPSVRIGFNAAEATQNRQFILNTLRWLAGVLSDPG